VASIESNSKIDLISRALILCGEKPINSLSDNRYGATVGANLFENVYESELQSNSWRFATAKKALSQLVATPLNQYTYAYQLPNDMLLLLGTYPVDLTYELYGDRMYSNRSSVEVEYMFKPEVTALPAYFTLLLVLALAKVFIKPITESDTAMQLMEKKYNMQRNVALYADAQQRPAKPIVHSPFTDNR
jgi:Tail tubular protein